MELPITIQPGTFYSTEQAAQALGTTERTMESWRLKGIGPVFIRMGGRLVRYKGDALLQFTNERTFRSTSEEAERAA